MASNIHQLIRYREIDKCLQQKGIKWDWDRLSRECGDSLRYYISSDMANPSRRTIMTDIENMRNGKLGYNAPIAYNKKENAFYYEVDNFSITQGPLSKEVIYELEQALIILHQYRGFEQIVGLDSITTQLEYSLLLQNKKKPPIIQFDHPLEAPGQEFLNELFQHIRNTKTLLIDYHPFDFEAPYVSLVSPYLLKEYNKRWNLIAFSHERERMEVFPLDRIQSIEKAGKKFIKWPHFHPENYFKEVIGVTVFSDRKLTKIEIIALPEQSKYIKTKPLHHSQKILKEAPDGSTTFSFQLIPNYELESLLLSFGEKIRVLKPVSLRRTLQKRLASAIGNYDMKI